MFNLLIDTCVWLDAAKDPRQQTMLTVLQELVGLGEVSLLVPQIIVDEFQRNKDRIIADSARSLSSTIKRVKEAVENFGDPKKKRTVLQQLNDVDHRLPLLGESVNTAIAVIEKLFAGTTLLQTTEQALLRAVQRAVDKTAPFHRNRNGMADAIIIELYAACAAEKSSRGIRFGFVTRNVNDFSEPNGNHNSPHPDLALLFSKVKSLYFIKLSDAIKRVRPSLVSELMSEYEACFEPRPLSELLEAERELFDKVWYDRHMLAKHRGDVERWEPSIRRGALKAAAKVERRYGRENLGPWSNFDWGMINGKLSALR
jgi:PIN domain